MSTPEDFSFPQPSESSPAEALRALRARAETRRNLVTQSTADKSPEEVQRLVQELQIHQIELEMQYEQLLQAQLETEAMRAQYVDLYDFAPVGYFTLDAHGLIQQLNLSGSQLLGTMRQRLVGRRFPLFVARTERETFSRFLQQVFQSESRQTCELEMQREDGTPFFGQLEGLAVHVTNASGLRITQCRLAIIDTTARHAAAAELAASEARFRQLFEQSGDAVLLVRGNSIIDCNRAALQLLGTQDPRQLVGQAAWAHAPEQQPGGQLSADQYAAAVAEAQRTGCRRGEFAMHRLDGQLIWVEAVITAITVKEQPLLHIVWRDVTANREAAELLRESEARLNLALDASGTGVFTWDFATNEVQWDEVAQTAFGQPYSPAKVSVQVLLSRLHPADAERVGTVIQAAIVAQEHMAIEYRVVWPADGSVHHITLSGRVVCDAQGNCRSFAGVVRDMTALRQAQEELGYKSMVLERLLAHMPMALFRLRPDGTYLESVGQGMRALQLEDNALVEHSVFDIFPALGPQIEPILHGAQIGFRAELELAGNTMVMQHYGFFDEQRQQAVVLAIDVTGIEDQKKQLRKEKEFSESLLDNSVDGIMAFDAQGHLLAWNRVMERHTGLLEAELLGRAIFDVFPEWKGKPQAHAIGQVLKGRRLTRYNMAFHNQPGHYEAYLVPLLGPDNAVGGGLVLVRDVTERVELAEEATRLKLRQQQEVLSAILTTQEEERRRIAEALHNGVGQLLYAAKLNLESRSGNATPSRATAISLLNDAIRATRTISFELTPGILEDFGLKIALEELVKRIPQQSLRIHLNLLGLDQPRPRQFEIAIYRVVQELLNNIIKHSQASEAFIHVVHECQQMHISVEDNGIGIRTDPSAPAVAGIGLAGIRTRLELLGGELNIASRLGSGTIVTVELTVKQ